MVNDDDNVRGLEGMDDFENKESEDNETTYDNFEREEPTVRDFPDPVELGEEDVEAHADMAAYGYGDYVLTDDIPETDRTNDDQMPTARIKKDGKEYLYGVEVTPEEEKNKPYKPTTKKVLVSIGLVAILIVLGAFVVLSIIAMSQMDSTGKNPMETGQEQTVRDVHVDEYGNIVEGSGNTYSRSDYDKESSKAKASEEQALNEANERASQEISQDEGEAIKREKIENSPVLNGGQWKD